MRRLLKYFLVKWLTRKLERILRGITSGYEPSHHYMRGPGPKTRAKLGAS